MAILTKSKTAKLLRLAGVIYNEPVKLTSGAIAPFYCDIKKAYGEPELLGALADHIGKNLEKTRTVLQHQDTVGYLWRLPWLSSINGS